MALALVEPRSAHPGRRCSGRSVRAIADAMDPTVERRAAVRVPPIDLAPPLEVVGISEGPPSLAPPRPRGIGARLSFSLADATRACKFLCVGASGVLVDLCAFTLLLELTPLPLARALAIWIAMTWNYALNRRWTFSGRERQPVIRQYGIFCLSCLLGALISWSLSLLLISRVGFFATRPRVAAFCGIVVGTISNYLLCLKVVFRARFPGPGDEAAPAP